MFSIWVGSTTRCSKIIFLGHLFLVVIIIYLPLKIILNNQASWGFFHFFGMANKCLIFLEISKKLICA